MVLFHPPQDGPFLYAPLFTRSIAGAESNLAIALTRLGRSVRWISRLGDDPFGDIIAATLAGEGVDTSFVVRDPTAPTAVFFRESKGYIEPHVYYYRRDSAASRLSPGDVDVAWFEGARCLHVTGITPALGEGAGDAITAALHQARDQGLTIVFDPNLRRKLWDGETARRVLLSMVPLCDIFLPGADEAEFLLGTQTPEDYAAMFLDMGPRMVVLKMGRDGAAGFVKRQTGDKVERYSVQAPSHHVAHVVDPIGAGDAFAAGLLSVLLEESPTSSPDLMLSQDTLQRALVRANLMGALATQFRGDWEGLPTLRELERIQSGVQQVAR